MVRKKAEIEKRIEEMEKEIELLRREVRYLKYVWDLEKIIGQDKNTHTTVFVDTRKKEKDEDEK